MILSLSCHSANFINSNYKINFFCPLMQIEIEPLYLTNFCQSGGTVFWKKFHTQLQKGDYVIKIYPKTITFIITNILL